MTPARRRFLIALALVAATLIVYRPVGSYGFINLDDPDYVQDNPLLRAEPLSAFTTVHAGYWIPLTWLSYQLDYHLYGLAPGGYHRTNLLLHAANALLLFLLLCRLTGAPWPSGFAAALFALHPLQVESVAWVTERKDVLSTFFGLLALHAYVSYTHNPSLRRYLPVLAWLALGLLAKPMLVTLPCVMLLLDYWPLNRLQARRRVFEPAGLMPKGDRVLSTQYSVLSTSSLARRASRLILEKLPLFALAFAASIVTVLAQRHGDAVRSLDEFSLSARLGNAAVSYVSYLEKLIWPVNLAVFYPHPGVPSVGQVAISVFVLAAITGFCLWQARSRPYLIVGWLWFAGTLFPVSGIMQAGWQGTADRFLYVPAIGLFILITWAFRDLSSIFNLHPAICNLQFPLALLVLAFLSVRTTIQLSYWRDSLTLWDHTRRVTPDNFYARFSHGAALLDAGRADEAAEHLRRAIELKPDHPFGHYELGIARRAQGRTEEAIACWTVACRLAPDDARVHHALASARGER